MTPTPPNDIRIPADLLPADGRFGSGPSKVRQAAVEALAGAAPGYLGTSHRKSGVKQVVRRVRDGLRDLMSLPDGHEVVLGNGGATQFWDIATFCLIERRSQHVVFGEFSSKFAAAAKAAPHLDDPDVIDADPGTRAEPVGRAGVDTYCLIHNETSTGVAAEVRRPPGADDGALVLVDATSAAGGMTVDSSQYDAYYFSPQKCFASEGGMWLSVLSPAAIERAQALKAGGRWVPASLDLTIAIENSRQDQTYNTPALATLFLLAHQIEWMNEMGGLESIAARCRQSAAALYGWAEAVDVATPFVADPSERSPVVATIDFDPAVDADTLAAVLRANGIVDTESYRKLGRNQLRVALFPAIEPDDVVALTRCLDYVVGALT